MAELIEISSSGTTDVSKAEPLIEFWRCVYFILDIIQFTFHFWLHLKAYQVY